MASFEREPVIAAARAILDLGGWCLLEACVDIPSQRWEARLLIFDLDADAVADAVAAGAAPRSFLTSVEALVTDELPVRTR